eukprot:scaffold2713_cov49-Prasinocladus_malaysianus.AAC.1
MSSSVRYWASLWLLVLLLSAQGRQATASSSEEDSSESETTSESNDSSEAASDELEDGSVCEFWGVSVGCNYNGDYKRPDRCKGLGRRYCDRAPEATECPEACTKSVSGHTWAIASPRSRTASVARRLKSL